MRIWTAGVAMMVAMSAAGVAWAQDDEHERFQDEVLKRMKERLKLTDEQAARIREIVQEGREAQEKLWKDRHEKIAELLDDEQKKHFEKMREHLFARAKGKGQGHAAQFFRLMAWLGEMKRELSVTDEQSKKIEETVKEFVEKWKTRFEEARRSDFEGVDWLDETQKFLESLREVVGKVGGQLTDEQRQKFNRIVAERLSGRPPVDERVRRVMEKLKIEKAEDAAAVAAAVKKVVGAKRAFEDFDREAGGKLKKLEKADATDEEVKAALEELRKGHDERNEAVTQAQKALAEMLTPRQQLELIKAGILR